VSIWRKKKSNWSKCIATEKNKTISTINGVAPNAVRAQPNQPPSEAPSATFHNRGGHMARGWCHENINNGNNNTTIQSHNTGVTNSELQRRTNTASPPMPPPASE
jgi:hypothetical protein